MNSLIIDDRTPSSENEHIKILQGMFQSAKESIDIASAYVTDCELIELFTTATKINIRLLISISAADVISGATSLDAILRMLKMGVNCRLVLNEHNFHPKVYIVDQKCSVLSSANFTYSAMNKNIEIGIALKEQESKQLFDWFESSWEGAEPLTKGTINRLIELKNSSKKEIDIVADVLPNFKDKFKEILVKANESNLVNLAKNSKSVFICNSNRRSDDQCEKAMLSMNYAAAWGEFAHTTHMEEVRKGDVVFLFAKKKGVIAIGEVTGDLEKIPNDELEAKAIYPHFAAPEWRLPVSWLAQASDENAFLFSDWHTFGATIMDISDAKYNEFKAYVFKYFLDLKN